MDQRKISYSKKRDTQLILFSGTLRLSKVVLPHYDTIRMLRVASSNHESHKLCLSSALYINLLVNFEFCMHMNATVHRISACFKDDIVTARPHLSPPHVCSPLTACNIHGNRRLKSSREGNRNLQGFSHPRKGMDFYQCCMYLMFPCKSLLSTEGS